MQELSSKYLLDEKRLEYAISHFKQAVSQKSSQHGLPVRFDNGYLNGKDKYMNTVFANGRKALDFGSWKPSDIGTRRIKDCVYDAFEKSEDLIYFDPTREIYMVPEQLYEVEKTFYDFYVDPDADDEYFFNKLMSIFGSNYNAIAYLFFLKDKERYLPCRPADISNRFRDLNIISVCFTGMSWEQYLDYIQIIKEIQNRITSIWDTRVSLLNAFSFVWLLPLIGDVLNDDEEYQNFLKNGMLMMEEDLNYLPENTEEPNDYESEEEQVQTISYRELFLRALERSKGKKKQNTTLVVQYIRDVNIKELAKRRAKGKCELCKNELDYYDKHGRPYLESHHLIPLEEGGADSIDNVVALCPNCHQRMHHANNKSDFIKLKEYVKEVCQGELIEYKTN